MTNTEVLKNDLSYEKDYEKRVEWIKEVSEKLKDPSFKLEYEEIYTSRFALHAYYEVSQQILAWTAKKWDIALLQLYMKYRDPSLSWTPDWDAKSNWPTRRFAKNFSAEYNSPAEVAKRKPYEIADNAEKKIDEMFAWYKTALNSVSRLDQIPVFRSYTDPKVFNFTVDSFLKEAGIARNNKNPSDLQKSLDEKIKSWTNAFAKLIDRQRELVFKTMALDAHIAIDKIGSTYFSKHLDDNKIDFDVLIKAAGISMDKIIDECLAKIPSDDSYRNKMALILSGNKDDAIKRLDNLFNWNN